MAGPGIINGREYRSIVAGIPLAEPGDVPALWWYREHGAGGVEYRYLLVMPDGRHPMSGSLWEPTADVAPRRAATVRGRLVEIDREAREHYGADVPRVVVEIIGDIVSVSDDR